jgi:hypothetical protein
MKSLRLERRTGKSNLLEGIAGTRQHGSDIPPQVPTPRESATKTQEGVRQTQPQAPKKPPGFHKTARDSDKTAWGFHKTTRDSEKNTWGFHKTARDSDKTAWGFHKTARGSDKTAWGFHKTTRGSDKTAWGFHKTARDSDKTTWGFHKTARGSEKNARGSEKTAWGFHKTARGSEKNARGFHKTARGFYHSQPDLPGSSEPLPASSRRFQAAAWITECSCLQPEGLADGSVRMLPASFEVGQTGFDLLPHIDLIHQIVPTRRVRQFTNQSGGRRLDVGSRNFDGRHDPSTPTCAQSSSKTFFCPHLLAALRAIAQRRVVR